MDYQIYRLMLDLQKTSSQAEIRAKVGDSGRKLAVKLTDGGLPFSLNNCTAKLKVAKPDGTHVFNTCTIDEDTVICRISTQTVSAVGVADCEVVIYDGSSKWIASPRFALIVEDSVYSDEGIESQDDFSGLQDALTAVSNINIDASKSGSKTTVTITGKDGAEKSVDINDGERGEPGEIGVGILSVGLLSTSGLEKTYRIYLSNGQTYDFTVNDGADGAEGPQGPQGETGAKGMGILSVSLLKTEGKEKTYRMFMTDDSTTKTYDYVITDGADGEPGETGVSVTGASVTDSGHLNITLSDGTAIDAGEIPQLVKSVNGKTGAIELSASDIGAPTDAEFDTVSVLSGLDSLFSTSASAMFGTSGMDINIGLSTQQPIYICLSASSGLSAGASITATPYWGGTSMQTAYAATGMKLNRWYQIGHPMVGSTIALPKINVKTDTGSMMTSSMNVFIRYTEVPGDTIDFTVAADAVACNAFVEEEVTSITTTNTPVTVSDTSSISKAYIYLRYPGTPTTSQVITATPVYSGAEYSAGVVSNMKLNRWYALGVPADGAALSAVALKVNTGTISSVTAIIRYDGNIDGNGVSY